jgi:hypothetical protein
VHFRSSQRPSGGSTEAVADGRRVRHEAAANLPPHPYNSADEFVDEETAAEERRQCILDKGKGKGAKTVRKKISVNIITSDIKNLIPRKSMVT